MLCRCEHLTHTCVFPRRSRCRDLAPKGDTVECSWAIATDCDALAAKVHDCLKMSAAFSTVFRPLCQKHEGIFTNGSAVRNGKVDAIGDASSGEAVCDMLLRPLELLGHFLRAVRSLVVAKQQYTELLQATRGLDTAEQLNDIESALGQIDALLDSSVVRSIDTEASDQLFGDAAAVETMADTAAAAMCREVIGGHPKPPLPPDKKTGPASKRVGSASKRLGSATKRPGSGLPIRPESASRRPGSGPPIRPGSASRRPGSAPHRAGSAVKRLGSASKKPDSVCVESNPAASTHTRGAMQELTTLQLFSSVVKRKALVPTMTLAYSAAFTVYELELTAALDE